MTRSGSIVEATQKARARTGNPDISTKVKQGKFRVCLVSFQKGRRGARIDDLTDWLTLSETIDYLDAMGVDTVVFLPRIPADLFHALPLDVLELEAANVSVEAPYWTEEGLAYLESLSVAIQWKRDNPRLLQWRQPVDDAERAQRFFLLEDRGNRFLVVDVRTLYAGRLASTSVVWVEEVDDVPEVPVCVG